MPYHSSTPPQTTSTDTIFDTETYGRDRGFSGVPLPPSDWEGWTDRKYKPSYHSKSWGDYFSHKREEFLDWVSGKFGVLGNAIENYPYHVIFVTIAISLLAVPGLFLMKMVNNPIELWIPRDLQVYSDYEHFVKSFGGSSRSAYFILQRRDRGDMLDREGMLQILEFHNSFTKSMRTDSIMTSISVQAALGASHVGFEEFCFRPYDDGPCVASNFLSVWDYNATKIPQEKQQILYDLRSFSSEFPLEAALGGITVEYGIISSAKAVRLQYSYRGETDTLDNEYNRDELDGKWTSAQLRYVDLLNWEAWVLETTGMTPEQSKQPLTTSFDNEFLEISRFLRRSMDDEITRLVVTDFPLFVLAILTIVGWLSITFGTMNRVESRFLVTWVVLIELTLCLVFSFGLMGYLQYFGNPLFSVDGTYTMSSLNAMVPFVLAGVAVDDMIVIEDFFNKCEGQPRRLQETMKAAGVAIVTTSLTTIATFYSGTYSQMPGVSSFCLCAYFAFLWDFVLNVTLFPAMIVLDQRRIEAKRHFLVPCKICHDFEFKDKIMHVHIHSNTANTAFAGAEQGSAGSLRKMTLTGVPIPPPPTTRPPPSPQTFAPTSLERASISESSRSSPYSNQELSDSYRISASSRNSDSDSSRNFTAANLRFAHPVGRKSSVVASFNRRDFLDLTAAKLKDHDVEHVEHPVADFMNTVYAQWLTVENVQACILTLSIVAAVGLGYMSQYNPKGLEVKEIVPFDSYISEFYELTDELFPSPNKPVSIVLRKVDYSNRDEVNAFLDYFGYIERHDDSSSKVGGSVGTWYDIYVVWLFSKGHDIYDDFYAHLHAFLHEDEIGINFQNEILCEESADGNKCGIVTSAKFFIWNTTPSQTIAQYKFANDVNTELRSSVNKDCFVFSEDYLFAYTDNWMYTYIIRNLSGTVALVFVVMFTFTDNVSCQVITLMVVLIDCDLLGFMYLSGIHVSSVSFICLLMGVGLSVDYCVHIGHAFTHSFGKTPNDRLMEAIKMMGTSVLKGGFTTFLGTIVLAFSSSSAFKTFFAMLFFTILLGMLHGLVALPVFLATVYNLGGRKSHLKHKDAVLGSDKATKANIAKSRLTNKTHMSNIVEGEDELDELERDSNGSIVPPPPPPVGRPDCSPPKLLGTPDQQRKVSTAVKDNLRAFNQSLSFEGLGDNPMAKAPPRQSKGPEGIEMRDTSHLAGGKLMEASFKASHAKKGGFDMKKGHARAAHGGRGAKRVSIKNEAAATAPSAKNPSDLV
jgi:predicted RND superfamily exporter protein